MIVSVETIYTDDATGERESTGVVIEDVGQIGEPVVLIGTRPITDMQQVAPQRTELAAWIGRASGYSDIRINVWEIKD